MKKIQKVSRASQQKMGREKTLNNQTEIKNNIFLLLYLYIAFKQIKIKNDLLKKHELLKKIVK